MAENTRVTDRLIQYHANRARGGASALPDDLSWLVPRALTTAEIHAMIDDFTQSALRLQRCGFSGVEISGGHGHLFHQFLSPWSNVRTDEYGGDTEGRTRFLAELIAALRAVCGRGFDMDHTEGTYAAAELLHARFDRVVMITPRESIAQNTALVTRQGILRRMHEKRIEIIPLAEPRWSASFNERRLEYTNVYNGDTGAIDDVSFFAYSTPRVAEDALAAPLRETGIEVHLIGDCRSPRGLLAATVEGNAVENML